MLVEQATSDPVVLDAMLPVIDGFELLRLIRERRSTAKVTVIMLTGRRQETDIGAALQLMADDFMVQSFIQEELLERLGPLIQADRA